MHRALADARATVDVLHGLLERLGPLGVQSLDELRTFTAQVSEAQRRKRHLAEQLPNAPGVYVFRDAAGRPLYVGKSKDIRTRVRHYFVASEMRARMAEMVGLAERVDAIVCAHALEAEVRELRLIAEHKPPYNRRSRFPERGIWLKLTAGGRTRGCRWCARCATTAAPTSGRSGPRKSAERAMAAVHDALPLRQCTDKITEPTQGSACALAEMGRCGAPCEGRISREEYGAIAALVRDAVAGDPRPLTEPLLRKVARLSDAGRYEQAATVRDRAGTFARACARVQRLAALTSVEQLVAARPDGTGGWELAVVRRGRLVAAGVAVRGAAVRPYVAALGRDRRVGAAGGRAAAVRDRRGDRADPALAGGAGHQAGRADRDLVPARPAAPAASANCSTTTPTRPTRPATAAASAPSPAPPADARNHPIRAVDI